jgi:aryl-alcohol dehydrogenase-like predicted oxidoreductase
MSISSEDGATAAVALDHYRVLGCSGLRVSPLALGTMTFGTDWGWGADASEARRIFDAYVDRGGNFIDTANVYTNGTSERLVGEFAVGRRDRLVIATKYTVATDRGDPNAGGNHRKSLMRAVDGSLERLKTDHVDLLYIHAWDDTTPPPEVLRAADDLVRAGKVLHIGISNTPAWRVAQLYEIANQRSFSPLVAMQVPYSLLERTVERDLLPMAQALGIAVTTYSPLANGVLTGKYGGADLDSAVSPTTRKGIAASNGELSERGLTIAEVVAEVASEIGRTSAQVALRWALLNTAVTAPVLGARTVEQLDDNLGALDFCLSAAQLARLEDASAIELGYPHDFLARPHTWAVMLGGVTIETIRTRPSHLHQTHLATL